MEKKEEREKEADFDNVIKMGAWNVSPTCM